MTRLAPRIICGRVITGGVAQAVTRQDGCIRIALTCMPGYPVSDEDVTRVPFGPVPVPAGTWVHLVIEWLPSGRVDDAGPVRIPVSTILDCAHVQGARTGGNAAPSAATRPSAASRRRGYWRSRS